MLLDFFNLREQPFGVTPDPRFLYFSPAHREALASLFYGIETGRGFLSLIAPPGMGKTTLLFQMLQRWKGYVHSAFLFQTQCNSKELLRYLLRDLGLNSDGNDSVRMHSELNQFLFREMLAGKRVVVFIDEAQNLADSVLETVRLFSNFEAADKKLMQIVLAGQPELEERLMKPSMTQLRQRLAVQTTLAPFPAEQVVSYINHRLRVAGHRGPELFASQALAFIAEQSQGIPRLINHLCFNSLTIGYAMKQERITAEIVRQAAEDLSLGVEAPKSALPKQRAAGSRVKTLKASSPLWWKQLKQNFVKRPVWQSFGLLLLLVSLAVSYGLRGKTGMAQPATKTHENAPSAPPTSNPQVLPVSPVTERNDDRPPRTAPESSKADDQPYFTYVVQPRDTLRQLCVSGLGRYDDAVLLELRKLNPGLKNSNRIEAGEEIRFPLELPQQKARQDAKEEPRLYEQEF